MPIRFASEPRSARLQAVETRDLFQQQNRKGKSVITKDKQAQGASFGGSFLVPEIDMIFGDGVGTSLVRGSYCQLGVGLMGSYIGTAQLKKVLIWT